MKTKPVVLMSSLLLVLIISGEANAEEKGDSNWPSFRGAHARGIAEGYTTPTSWNLESNKNIRWKVPVPGLAHSAPVVWGDSIFVTSSVGDTSEAPLRVGLYGDIEPVEGEPAQQWRVYRLDKKTGKVLWERTVHEGVAKTKRHPKSTHANPTPATDGTHVVVFFGSEGLYCYDFSGKLLWKKDLGVLDSAFFVAPEAQWGFASSPIIHGDKVYVQCDVMKDSFLAAFNLEDGSEVWRTPRSDVPTWSTPTIHAVDGRDMILVNGWKHIGGYDATTGKEVWKLSGGGDIPVPTPVVAHDLVFITNAHGPASPIYAIRLNAKGDISLADGESANEHIAWSIGRGGAYMQTPLVYGDYLYNCRDNGVLSCYKATTGERMYQERLGPGGRGGFSASSVAAEGKLYYTSETGDVYVVRTGPTFELLAVNSMDEVTMATPAISEGTIYFRTRGHLVAVGSNEGN